MGDKPTPEGLALIEDLVNTLDLEPGDDSLASPNGLAAFSGRHGLRLAETDAPGARLLREALRGACVAHNGHPMSPADSVALSHLLAAAPLTLRVNETGGAALLPVPGLSALADCTARIAAAIATAEADGTWPRLKACEAETCRWVYYDHSPASRRRWCSMQLCGARAKMRSYRAKRRVD